MSFDTYGSALSLKSVILFDKFGFLTNRARRPLKGEVKDGKICPLLYNLEAEYLTNCNPTIQITSRHASETAAGQFKSRILSLTNDINKNFRHSNIAETAQVSWDEAGNLVYKNGLKKIYVKECFVKVTRVKWPETAGNEKPAAAITTKPIPLACQQLSKNPIGEVIGVEQDALIINRDLPTKKRMPFSPSKSVTVSVDIVKKRLSVKNTGMPLKGRRSISEAMKYSAFAENPSISKDELREYFIAKNFIAYKFRFPRYRVGSHPRSGMFLRDVPANTHHCIKHRKPYEADPVDDFMGNLVEEILLLQEEGVDFRSTLELKSEPYFDCIKSEDDEELMDPEELNLDLTMFTGISDFDCYLV